MSIEKSEHLTLFYRRAHRVTVFCGALHLLLCLVFAAFTDTWLMTLLVGVPALLIPWWLSRAYPAEPISRLSMSVAFMVFTGLIVQQTHGDMEAHFSFFAMMSILVVYCDWRTIVVAYVTIALHHLIFTMLQPMGFGFAIWGDQRGPWGHFIVHGAVGAAQAAALCYLSIMMRRMVLGSMQVSAMAKLMAAGHLDTNVAGNGSPPSEMMATMGHMQQRLGDMVGQVSAAVTTMGTAVGEIAQGTADLSSRTEANAARTQRVSSELTEFIERSRLGLESTAAADLMSEDARQSAAQAGDVMGRVVTTMKDIEASSKKIADIVALIDGIAFQTNILALNAAVEAARAGEQGRGFAVVAAEVRNLSQRSAAAAREIRVLISNATGRIASGSDLVIDARKAMEKVAASVHGVRGLIQKAARSGQDERPRLEKLGSSLTEIDNSMQQNASFVEQLSATTQSLRDQEHLLRESIETFVPAGRTPALCVAAA